MSHSKDFFMEFKISGICLKCFSSMRFLFFHSECSDKVEKVYIRISLPYLSRMAGPDKGAQCAELQEAAGKHCK